MDDAFDKIVDNTIAQLNGGVTLEEIRQKLAARGYSKEYIDEIFAEIQAHEAPKNAQPSATEVVDALGERWLSQYETIDTRHGFRGRVNLRAFWIGHCYTAILFIGSIAGMMFGLTRILEQEFYNETLTMVVRFVCAFTLLCAAGLAGYGTISLNVRRRHDLNQSGGWWLLYVQLIPFFFLVTASPLFFRKGDDKENQFGPPSEASFNPLKLLGIVQ